MARVRVAGCPVDTRGSVSASLRHRLSTDVQPHRAHPVVTGQRCTYGWRFRCSCTAAADMPSGGRAPTRDQGYTVAVLLIAAPSSFFGGVRPDFGRRVRDSGSLCVPRGRPFGWRRIRGCWVTNRRLALPSPPYLARGAASCRAPSPRLPRKSSPRSRVPEAIRPCGSEPSAGPPVRGRRHGAVTCICGGRFSTCLAWPCMLLVLYAVAAIPRIVAWQSRGLLICVTWSLMLDPDWHAYDLTATPALMLLGRPTGRQPDTVAGIHLLSFGAVRFHRADRTRPSFGARLLAPGGRAHDRGCGESSGHAYTRCRLRSSGRS